MNSVSWLLYAAEVTDSLKTTVGITMLASAMVGAFVALMAPMALDVLDWGVSPKQFYAAIWKTVRVALPLALLLYAALPSKGTIMLIAASQVGESIITSAEAQKIGGEAGALANDSLRLLRKYVNDQLQGETE